MPLHTNLFVETNPAPAKYALSLLGRAQVANYRNRPEHARPYLTDDVTYQNVGMPATKGIEDITENAIRAVARDCGSLSMECSDVAGYVAGEMAHVIARNGIPDYRITTAAYVADPGSAAPIRG